MTEIELSTPDTGGVTAADVPEPALFLCGQNFFKFFFTIYKAGPNSF